MGQGVELILRKLLFGPKNEESFNMLKILIKKSLYKIDIFKICMKYFLYFSRL